MPNVGLSLWVSTFAGFYHVNYAKKPWRQDPDGQICANMTWISHLSLNLPIVYCQSRSGVIEPTPPKALQFGGLRGGSFLRVHDHAAARLRATQAAT